MILNPIILVGIRITLSTMIKFCKIQIRVVYMWSEFYMIVMTIANKFLITLMVFLTIWGFFFLGCCFQFPNPDLPAGFSYWDWLPDLLMIFLFSK